jgi:hypothetical protein
VSFTKNTCLIKVKTLWERLPETAKAMFVLAIVLIAFTHPFFFQGKQFSPMDVLYLYYPWKAVAPAWYEQPSNALRWDDASKFYPGRVNLLRNFRQDGVTFWQTDHLSGTPNRPTLHRYGLLFYPLVWLFFFLPFNTANSLIHILNLFIAGISMWLLLREHKLSPISALSGAIVYMLNGYFIVWMSAFFLPGILALLPLLLFLYERLLRRQQVVYAMMAALLIALQFYLGYPPGSILFLVFFGLYCLVSLIRLCIQRRWRTAFRTVGFLGLAVIIAAGLSAFYLIPTMQQLAGSPYMMARGSGGGNTVSISWEHLLGFLFPNFWGNPTSTMGNVWVRQGNYCEAIAYWGIAPLILAVFGLLMGRKQGQLCPFVLSSLILSLSVTYGVPPLNYLQRLPGFSGITITRWQFGISLAGSVLAASGLDYLLMLKQRQRIGSAFVCLLVGGVFGYLVATIASPESIRARFADYPPLIQSHYWQIGMAVACLTLLALYILLHKRIPRTLFGILVLGLIVVDLFAFGMGFNPYIAAEDLYPETPGIRFLQSQTDLYRIAPWGAFPGIFPVNTANVYGISTVTGMDLYRNLTYRAFLEPLMTSASQDHAQRYGSVNIDHNLHTNRSLLDMLNVRYIITAPEHNSFEQLNTAYRGPDMRIYENPFALPRTWGVPRYELVSNEQALSRVHEADFDARLVVLLEQNPGLDPDQPSCSPRELQSEVVAYAQDEIIVHTDFACNGLLVVSERFAPEWQATVDGESSAVLRADYLLRAVVVPAGEHTVHFQYHPSANLWGLGISLSALILFCGLLGFVWKRWPGAAILGVLIPTLMVIWFGRPFKKPVPPAERLVEIGTPARSSIAPHPQQARLEDKQGEIAFLGYELDKTVLVPGDTLRLTLYWRNESRVGQDYTIFTHLLGESYNPASGNFLWGQKDSMPFDGTYPTSRWLESEVVVDRYAIAVQPDAPPGLYRVEVGMYLLETGQRLPVFDDRGQPMPEDRALLEEAIEVVLAK